MFYKWGGSDILSISTFNHYSRILKVVAGGGGGGPTFGKNSQIISFFFERAYLRGNVIFVLNWRTRLI